MHIRAVATLSTLTPVCADLRHQDGSGAPSPAHPILPPPLARQGASPAPPFRPLKARTHSRLAHTRPSVRQVLVLDKSGSMGPYKNDLKTFALTVIEQFEFGPGEAACFHCKPDDGRHAPCGGRDHAGCQRYE